MKIVDEAIEGGDYTLTHPDTEREYETDVSVLSVTTAEEDE